MSNYIPLDKPTTITEQVWPEHTIPVVSVFNWVYNHKAYIRESIESILVQKTTFPIEIIIHDDASNDGTAEIIKEYEIKHPHLFKNILHKENQWSQGKNVMVPLFDKPRGKYIALTHGDDYWKDVLMLQKQVDYLEANPNKSGSFCKVFYVDHANNLIGESQSFSETNFTFEQIVQQYSIHTVSLVIRNLLDKDFLRHLLKYPYGDLPLSLFILTKGNFHYIDTPMATYRKNVGVMQHWNAIDGFEKKVFIIKSILSDYKLTPSQKNATKWSLAYLYLKLSKHYANENCTLKSIKSYVHFLRYILYGLFTQKHVSITYKDILRPLYIILRNKIHV